MRKIANDIIVQIARAILLSTDEELADDYNGKDVEILRKCFERIEEARKKTTEKRTTEKRTTEKRTTEKRTTEKRTTEKRTTEKRTTEKRNGP